MFRNGSQEKICLVGAPVNSTDDSDVRQAIAASGVEQRIECLQQLTDDELGQEYARATAFVMPSLDEGFSLPLLEAMANGLPICAADAGAIPEVAGAAAIYFDPSDENDMVDAIGRVLRESFATSLRRKARERFRELDARDFSGDVQTMVNQVLEQNK